MIVSVSHEQRLFSVCVCVFVCIASKSVCVCGGSVGRRRTRRVSIAIN